MGTGKVPADLMPFTGLTFKNNFNPTDASNDTTVANELNTLKAGITGIKNGDYLIVHETCTVSSTSLHPEQVDLKE